MIARGGRITWVASYPRSGSTWVRAFLSGLLSPEVGAVHINRLDRIPHGATRRLFDDLADLDSSDLTPDETDELRPLVYETLARAATAAPFLKVHDRYRGARSGAALFPAGVTRGAIYVVRNPLDVACSYAAHRGTSIDEAIDAMADEGHALADPPGGIQPLLPQPLGSWSTHVESWLAAPGFPVHRVRYEDLARQPTETFHALACFLGIDAGPDEVGRAASRCAFATLRRQEEEDGFREGSLDARRFFRRGEVGAWRDELSPARVQRVVEDHGAVMRRLGYLDARGAPLP